MTTCNIYEFDLNNLPHQPSSATYSTNASVQSQNYYSIGYMIPITPALVYTNNTYDSQQNLHQPCINPPVYHNSSIIYPVYFPVIGVLHNYHPAVTNSSDHNPQEEVVMTEGIHDPAPNYLHSNYDPNNEENLELEQMGRDDDILSDTAVEPPFDLNMLPPTEEEDDEQHTDHNIMHVPENNHPSLTSTIVHYPEEEVAMIEGTHDPLHDSLASYYYDLNYEEEVVGLVIMIEGTHDPWPESLASNYDLSYEENLELEEQMGRVDSRLSEETIIEHLKIIHYTGTTISPNEEPDICVICQSEFKNDEFIGGLHCQHEYHVNCIRKWLLQVNSCPICKATAVS